MQRSAVIILSLACLGDLRNINRDNFKMLLSPKYPRAGDLFNVTFRVTSTDDLPEDCTSIDQVYMQSKKGENLTVHILNNTALYHNASSAVAVVANGALEYEALCNGASLTGVSPMIGAKLENIDFNCICWVSGDMVCTFSKPQFDKKEGYYRANFTLHREGQGTPTTCSYKDKSETQVECKLTIEPLTTLTLSLNMTDDGGEQGLTFNVSQQESIMMDALTEWMRLNHTSNSICLSFKNELQSEYNVNAIEWSVYLTDHNHTFQSINNTSEYETNVDIICVWELLYPHYSYTFDIKRRANSKAPWSPSFVHSFSTAAALPSGPPLVWPSGYELNLDEGTLSVYWQQLDELKHNGENFTYNVSVQNNNKNNRSLIKHVKIDIRPSQAIISKLNMKSGSYIIIIRSQNEIGVSENSSEIVVEMSPEPYKLMPRNVTLTEKLLVWAEPQRTDQLQSYTVFWCKLNGTNHRKCNDTLSIMSEQVVHTKCSFMKEGFGDGTFIWAVSANYGSGSGSGGMRWMNPLYTEVHHEYHGGMIDSLKALTALVVLVVVTYAVIRRCRFMSNIGVDLPEGLFKELELNTAEQPSPKEAHEKTTDLVNAPEMTLELLTDFRPHDDFTAQTQLPVNEGYLKMDPQQVNAEYKFLTSQGRTITALGYCSTTQMFSDYK
ncbi:cytokine receptor [Drosophila grimshawi]|uniref:GH12260 n=1 Tax=Drosophila grimshawi TaxID=7222 RepID=B4JJH0_DROGR|nr:cytokine receptor [Drosophila grimshawi]EDV99722.1 GH12260 [Drosophila grimshawi]